MSAGPIDLSSVCGIGPEAMITDRLPFSSIIIAGPAFSRTCIERRPSRPSPHQRAAAADHHSADRRLRFFYGRARLDDDRRIDPGDGRQPGREPAAAQPGHHELSVEPGRVYSGQRLDRRPARHATRVLRRGADLCRWLGLVRARDKPPAADRDARCARVWRRDDDAGRPPHPAAQLSPRRARLGDELDDDPGDDRPDGGPDRRRRADQLCLVALDLLSEHPHRRARRSASPVLDLNLLKIKTFYVGTVTGGICRMGLDATPFMLPLLFQVGFGLSPIAAGLLSFSSTLGAMFVRSFSRILLRGLGFRRTLVGGAVLSAAVTASYALLSADTPAWIITVAVLISGCVRSIQYLALNTISYAEVPRSMLSRSTSLGGVVQQLARGFGVAIGAALLAMVAGSERVTVGDFRIVFLLVALIPLLSAFGFLRLGPDDGAEVSGQR